MKKLLVVLDDELAKELKSYPNQSEVVRNALRVYIGHITPEVIKGLQVAYGKIHERLAGIELATEKIAQKAEVTIDKHSEWGA